MRPLMRLLLGLMVALSLGMGAIAHAGEALTDGDANACIESAAHEQRDDEPRDGDSDKWGLHAHGGCHGHHQGDTVGKGNATLAPPIRALNFAGGDDFLPQLVPDASLRPPIA
ncbi:MULTISPECIES: hypothetical protein [unclassified Sphingopyxis]|uniref:hypothetical protein n=1 Tax=unclassified Sphingopyxis TaxID=2614943 RepID=UPI000735E666|nr:MULTISPECIES: hypothetical protein [unclassified Sphingopyxis]KTE38366.1 hypothetical protein ATE62_11110 [Sphingopyxis sp. HIX]KTE85456.1 hypothetical protein ATE72_03115 [Sphingopyxis sp. HXXIV]